MKTSSKFVLAVQKVILALLLVLVVLILCGTVLNGSENLFTDLFSPFFTGILLLLLSVTICLLVLFLYHRIDCFKQRWLILASVLLFFFMAFVFVIVFCNFRCAPYTDALYVQDTALYFAQTGADKITEESGHYAYYMRFGNNNFLTILLSFFYRILLRFGISDVVVPTEILCALGVMAAAVFAYLICVRIGGLQKGVKFLLLAVMNPLYYLLALWGYSVVISIPFMMAVLYFGICAFKAGQTGKRILFCVLLLSTAVLGYYIRPTVLIPVIAIACLGVLLVISRGKKLLRKFLPGVLIGVLASVLVFAGIETLDERYFSEVLADNFPVTHWLMMGSHGDGSHDEADVEFTKSFETKQEKRRATILKTKENYADYTIGELFVFMGRKIFLTWCQGDGGDLLSKIRQDTRQTALNSWVLGERNDLLRLYCYAFWFSMFLLALWSLIQMLRSKKILTCPFLFALTLLGGILFYLIWEAKANYSLPFVYILLLLALQGAECARGQVLTLMEKIPCGKAARSLFAAAGLGVLFVIVFSCVKLTGSSITLTERSTVYSTPVVSTKGISYKGELTLTQDFYASRPFDTLVIAEKGDADETKSFDSYRFTLENEAGLILCEKEIHFKDAEDNRFLIETGEIVPDGREKFVIKIQSEGKESGKIKFLERRNFYVDMYEGTLIVNGEIRRNDLWLQVYEKHPARRCPPGIALLVFGGWSALLFALGAWLIKGRNHSLTNASLSIKMT